MEIQNLAEQIENGKFTFKDSKIYLNAYELDYLYFENIERLFFENCTFYGDFILSGKTNKTFILIFKHCSFENNIKIEQCEFDALTFLKIYKAKEISIIEGDFRRISFTSEKNETAIIPKIYISAKIITAISFSDFKLEGNLFLNYGSSNGDYSSYSTFNNSEFNDFQSVFMDFGHHSTFENCRIKNSFNLYNCTFNYTNFSKFTFPINSNFNDTTFNKYANFKNCSSQSKQTLLSIQSCTFKELVEFDNSIINSLDIKTTIFEQISSFQNLLVESIRISKSTFSKPAYFDDLKIHNISNLKTKAHLFSQSDWKITLRTIKHELQKTENRIDFNRFKNYEMSAYYEELNWKNNFVNKSILFATKWATDFGNSWTRALKFTTLTGLFFYTLFFLSENYIYSFNIKYWREFISGLFRFFLVTDFFNPLVNDRVYLTNPLSWLIFILGKIIITFGIYEMIQSFRKFKA